MQIVVEYVLLENFLINLIVLKTTSLFLKDRGRLFFLSAFFGACLTAVMPFFYLSSVGWFLVEIGQAILSVCISFKFKKLKKFLQIFLCYFASAFLYGGACYFFEGFFGVRSVLIILAIISLVFFSVSFLVKKFFRKTSLDNFCFDVVIEANGQRGKWKAFLDSGNMLFDPVTDSPVSLINYRVFSTLFKEIDLEDVIRKSEKLKTLPCAHYINFNTLGSDNKILVFQVDRLSVDGKETEKATLGLSFKNFNEAFESDIILNNSFAISK